MKIFNAKLFCSTYYEKMIKINDDLKNNNIYVKLSIILIGQNSASLSYVNVKKKACEKMGMACEIHYFDEGVKESQIINFIQTLNEDSSVYGILVQLPLVKNLNKYNILSSISLEKDVDGLNPLSLGLVEYNGFIPATPLGILHLIEKENIQVESKHIILIGFSNLIGKPLVNLLADKYKATVTILNEYTKYIDVYTKMADILISATGRAELIKDYMIKPKSILIDVGFSKVWSEEKEKFLVKGDILVNDELKEKAEFLTPVPNGVGPLTVCMLCFNVLKSAYQRHNLGELQY